MRAVGGPGVVCVVGYEGARVFGSEVRAVAYLVVGTDVHCRLLIAPGGSTADCILSVSISTQSDITERDAGDRFRILLNRYFECLRV